jgi:DNA invertase Pin-like site-specific DNA recombinase
MSELAAALRSLQHALDEHEARLAALEQSPMRFSQAEAVRTRREVVKRMRAAGLSAERIARATGAGRTTVMRDIAEAQIPAADHVTGVNGRGWSRRNGGETAA